MPMSAGSADPELELSTRSWDRSMNTGSVSIGRFAKALNRPNTPKGCRLPRIEAVGRRAMPRTHAHMASLLAARARRMGRESEAAPAASLWRNLRRVVLFMERSLHAALEWMRRGAGLECRRARVPRCSRAPAPWTWCPCGSCSETDRHSQGDTNSRRRGMLQSGQGAPRHMECRLLALEPADKDHL